MGKWIIRRWGILSRWRLRCWLRMLLSCWLRMLLSCWMCDCIWIIASRICSRLHCECCCCFLNVRVMRSIILWMNWHCGCRLIISILMCCVCRIWWWAVWWIGWGCWLWRGLTCVCSCRRGCWLRSRRSSSIMSRLGRRSRRLCCRLNSRLSSRCCCWYSRSRLSWLRCCRCWSNSSSIWYLTRLGICNSCSSSSIWSRNILNTSMSLFFLFFIIIIVIIFWFFCLFWLLWFWILFGRLVILLSFICFWRFFKFIFFYLIRLLLSSLFLIAY